MLLDALKTYCPTATPMHMPGHMRNEEMAVYLKELGAGWDITEINGFDDLHHPEGLLLESMQAAARLWKSDHARYLVNGATCGILAAVYALSPLGGCAVCARNAHKSLYHALEITGVRPVFVMSGFDEETGACTDVSAASVKEALDRAPDARFVFVTSPTYEGVISDIKAICDIAHERGVPVIVDEAHGAHLGLSEDFPGGAVQAGADIVIQSVHKTLASLTQTAILHISGRLVSRENIDHALDVFETSSPSYLLMASIDGCVRLMEKKGEEILHQWRTNTDDLRERMKGLRNVRLWQSKDAFGNDPSKLVLFSPFMSGMQIMETLRSRFSIELEAAYARYAVAMTGAGTKKESLQQLFKALCQMDAEGEINAVHSSAVRPVLAESVMSIKEALKLPYEVVALPKAAGRICAEYAWAYPPGVPVLAPGERIGENSLLIWAEYQNTMLNTMTTRSGGEGIAVLKEKD